MFTWICPQCGREVPPAYTDCPNCSGKGAEQAAAGQSPVPGPPPQAPPPPPGYGQPPAAYPPQYQQPYQAPYQPPYQQPPYPQPPQAANQQPQPVYQAPPDRHRPNTLFGGAQTPVVEPPPMPQQPAAGPHYQPPPPDRHGPQSLFSQAPPAPQAGAPPTYQQPYYGQQRRAPLPTWLLTILFTLAFVGIGSGIYWMVGFLRGRGSTPPTVVESPAAKPGAATNAFQKYIEVSGVRFLEDPKHKNKVLARFVIINHSTADISGLAGNVTIWGSTKRSEEDATGTFAFNTNLSPSESKELTVPMTTKLKIYELPDWQNATPDVQITAPGS